MTGLAALSLPPGQLRPHVPLGHQQTPALVAFGLSEQPARVLHQTFHIGAGTAAELVRQPIDHLVDRSGPARPHSVNFGSTVRDLSSQKEAAVSDPDVVSRPRLQDVAASRYATGVLSPRSCRASGLPWCRTSFAHAAVTSASAASPARQPHAADGAQGDA